MRALALIGVLGAFVCGCNQPPAQVATESGIGLQGIACALDVYAVDTAQGKSVTQAVGDAVIQCAKYGVSEAQAAGLFQSHRMAETREHAPSGT